MAKFWGLALAVVVAVAIADLVAHPSGTSTLTWSKFFAAALMSATPPMSISSISSSTRIARSVVSS